MQHKKSQLMLQWRLWYILQEINSLLRCLWYFLPTFPPFFFLFFLPPSLPFKLLFSFRLWEFWVIEELLTFSNLLPYSELFLRGCAASGHLHIISRLKGLLSWAAAPSSLAAQLLSSLLPRNISSTCLKHADPLLVWFHAQSQPQTSSICPWLHAYPGFFIEGCRQRRKDSEGTQSHQFSHGMVLQGWRVGGRNMSQISTCVQYRPPAVKEEGG